MPNINQHIKQSWRLIGQNKLAASLSILGTAVAVCMIMVFVILFIANTASFKPETHRADTYYVTVPASTYQGALQKLKIAAAESKQIVIYE